MVEYVQAAAVILAGISVAVADALIKKISVSSDLLSAFKDPIMLVVLLLYLLQVLFFVYVFSNGWNLGIVGNLQMVFYSIGVVTFGLLFFGESITLVQGVGIVLALIGVILMNI